MEKDCFAYVNSKKCSALKVKKCPNCPFFKTKDKYTINLSKLSEYAYLKRCKNCFGKHEV